MDEETNNLMEGFSSGKVEFSKPLLVMLALKDCREKRAVEMKEGYFNETLDKDKKRVRTWIPDSRKIFIGSITSLKILLSPEIKQDKDFKETYEKLKKQKNKVFEKHSYTKKVLNSEGKVIETNEKYIPPIDESVILQDPKTKKNILQRGGWNKHTNDYFNDLIPIYDRLFEELNNLIHRMGYYKKKQRFG